MIECVYVCVCVYTHDSKSIKLLYTTVRHRIMMTRLVIRLFLAHTQYVYTHVLYYDARKREPLLVLYRYTV